jgi:hypothetical protein
MKRIYEVEFEEKWRGCAWVENSLKVAGNGDMQHAIAKAKKNRLAQHFTDENDKEQKCIGFRPLGVKVIATADI